MEKGGLPHKDVPQVSLPVVAGKDLADAGYLPLRQGLDGDIVVHLFFILSQPFDGCVQKPQPLRNIVPLLLQLRLTRRKEIVELFAVVVDGQDGADVGETEAHVAQCRDAADGGQLRFAVVALVGKAVNLSGL